MRAWFSQNSITNWIQLEGNFAFLAQVLLHTIHHLHCSLMLPCFPCPAARPPATPDMLPQWQNNGLITMMTACSLALDTVVVMSQDPTPHSGSLPFSVVPLVPNDPHRSDSSSLIPSKTHSFEIAVTLSPETSELSNPMNSFLLSWSYCNASENFLGKYSCWQKRYLLSPREHGVRTWSHNHRHQITL